MDEPRHDFLADSTLSGDEDLRIRPGCAFDVVFDLLNGSAVADKLQMSFHLALFPSGFLNLPSVFILSLTSCLERKGGFYTALGQTCQRKSLHATATMA
jgi:hypothetical protein